jgi:hypothetical protein
MRADRFHFFFATLAMIWICVATYLLRELRYESQENLRLHIECINR